MGQQEKGEKEVAEALLAHTCHEWTPSGILFEKTKFKKVRETIGKRRAVSRQRKLRKQEAICLGLREFLSIQITDHGELRNGRAGNWSPDR